MHQQHPAFISEFAARITPIVPIPSPSTETGCATAPLARVGEFLQALSVGRELTDQELRQHIKDCAWLMEQSYGRFQRFGDVHGREEAVQWLARRDEALRTLQARGTSMGGDDGGWFASDEAHARSGGRQ